MTDFKIKVPYTMHPQMNRFEGVPFNKEPSDTILELKRRSLGSIDGTDYYGLTKECERANLVYKATQLCGVDGTNGIVEFALNFEEDVAIIHHGVLVAICFCSPSSWIPRQRLGHSLMQIHTNVADGEKLVAASNRIAETISNTKLGMFRRYVWTISNSGELNQHPKHKSDRIPESIDDLYFRTETQTTVPLGDDVSSLFFVKVETMPLSHIFRDIETKIQIIDSIKSMSESIVDYKNLRYIRQLLIN